MQRIRRRLILQAAALAVAGGALTEHVPGVYGDTHDPPGKDEVDVGGPHVMYVEPSTGAGFHYPYLLYTPPDFDPDGDHERPLLVEPNNTPSSEDGFEPQLEAAESVVQRFTGRKIADEIDIPLLVPIFPRYRDKPYPWYIYVQVLDQSTFELEESPLERVDLQLLSMVDDAVARLENDGYNMAAKFHLEGFSASSNFVNRFTFIHPERVNAVANGGDGKFMLPKEEVDDDVPAIDEPEMDELPYPVGVANLEELTGEPFDKETWLDVPQFLYTGGEDQPEPGSGGHRSFPNLYDEEAIFTRPEDRPYGLPDLIEDVFGVLQVDERFEVSRAAYDNVGSSAEFTIYEGWGHTPEPAMSDLIDFHQRQIYETFGPQFDVSTDWSGPEIQEGETLQVTVMFLNLGTEPASTSATLTVDGDAIETVNIDVGLDGTATAEFKHTFDEPGTYALDIKQHDIDLGELKVVIDDSSDNSGEEEEDTQTPVDESNDNDNRQTPQEPAEQDDAREGDDGFGPGFGLITTLAGLAGLGYILNQEEEE